MAFKLIGKDFLPLDVVAKVTGQAKYAEDFRADGMIFCKLVTSPMPHARVKKIDAAEALKMPGVIATLTADEVPQFPPPQNPILTNEPLFVGDAIMAVAAVDELTAAEAIEKIKIDLEPLPFVLDPLDSLHPGGPNARTNGNVAGAGINLQTVKWEAADFARGEDKLPLGKPAEEWKFGDLEAGFKAAKVIVEESFVSAGLSHHCMEPRSTMAYWQGGKCFVHGSSQSHAFTLPPLARFIGIEPKDLVLIGENCGGGFGSKAGAYPTMAVPALLAKKTGRPVMLRFTRHDEYSIGTARPGFQGWIKLGFREDGRITAADLYVIQENGPNQGSGDFRAAGNAVSILYQPLAMRHRMISVLTNTPIRGPQRGPGENQLTPVVEPMIDKAARELKLDRVAIRKINSPDKDGKFGAEQGPVTSAFMREALEKGAQLFNWEEKKKRSGQRVGSKVYGVGVGQGYHSAGNSGFDGLVRITPDGKLHVHAGEGNLGTYSYAATSRVPAEVLNYKWENVVVEYGDTRHGVPWTVVQAGSNTTFTMQRAKYVAAMDLKKKLLEIAALDLGGSPDDYDLGAEVVVKKGDPAKTLTYAKAAQRAIQLGGKFSGQTFPDDLNPITKEAMPRVAGTGLIGVAKDTLPRRGVVPGLTVSFAEVAVDVETGKVAILSMASVADVGTVMHPQGLDTQIKGGNFMGIGMAQFERHFYDPKLGLPGAVMLYQAKPPSYLDVPVDMKTGAVELADPQNPMGGKGVGEPVQGSGAAAVTTAIVDALGGRLFNRIPIVPDMIINALAGRPQAHKPLQVNTL